MASSRRTRFRSAAWSAQNGPTTLATIVQLDPIYVTFNVSEQDVLRIRASLRKRGLDAADLNKVPVEIGLMTEQGYPHKGTLDYASPRLDPQPAR